MKAVALLLFASALRAQITIPDAKPGASSDERIHAYQQRLEKTPGDPKLIGGATPKRRCSRFAQTLPVTGGWRGIASSPATRPQPSA